MRLIQHLYLDVKWVEGQGKGLGPWFQTLLKLHYSLYSILNEAPTLSNNTNNTSMAQATGSVRSSGNPMPNCTI